MLSCDALRSQLDLDSSTHISRRCYSACTHLDLLEPQHRLRRRWHRRLSGVP